MFFHYGPVTKAGAARGIVFLQIIPRQRWPGTSGALPFQRGRRQVKQLSRAFRGPDTIEREDTNALDTGIHDQPARGFATMARHPSAA